MSQERTYTDYDMNVAYEEGRRAARQRAQGSGGGCRGSGRMAVNAAGAGEALRRWGCIE